MFKCCDCGKTFNEAKIVTDNVPYGEGSVPLNLSQCPYCNGSFDMAFPCKDCERYFFEDELHSCYCDDCLKENFDDPEDLFEFAQEITAKDCINQFVLDVLGGANNTNDIIKLLLKTIYRYNPQMLKEKKEKFIEKYADELGEYWEKKYGEQSEIF